MKRFLYAMAKTWLGGIILHWIFAYFSFVIPGERLIENDWLIAFHHPSPSYPLHILIVPRSKFRSLMDLPSDEEAFQIGIFKAVKQLVKRFRLDESSYRLIVNGGSAQEVDHLHFHLISDDYDSNNLKRISK